MPLTLDDVTWTSTVDLSRSRHTRQCVGDALASPQSLLTNPLRTIKSQGRLLKK
jgi:hypothetical protein